MDTSLETNLYMKLIPGAEMGLLCALLAAVAQAPRGTAGSGGSGSGATRHSWLRRMCRGCNTAGSEEFVSIVQSGMQVVEQASECASHAVQEGCHAGVWHALHLRARDTCCSLWLGSSLSWASDLCHQLCSPNSLSSTLTIIARSDCLNISVTVMKNAPNQRPFPTCRNIWGVRDRCRLWCWDITLVNMSQCLRGLRSLSRLCRPVGSLVGTFCFDLFLICTRYGNLCDAALAVKASDSAMF